ncbi:MAG: aminotransferase class I/II-fold pyridoxal phosphate-dependent enzyme [Saprospiraceae bacterium]
MNYLDKLRQKASHIHQYSSYYGRLHHIEFEGQVASRMKNNGEEYIIWCINDYLGLMNHPLAKQAAAQVTRQYGEAYPHAARITFGNSKAHEQLEAELAQLLNKEATFAFNLGYPAILSIVDALTDRHDTIIYDQRVHASLIDGIRLHNGRKFAFRHNDIAHFTRQLERVAQTHNHDLGAIYVVLDGVYSMLGDTPPLKEIVALKKKYNFSIVLDDCHGFGVLGENGRGTPEAFDVEKDIDVYIATFTKAFGSLGGLVGGRKDLIDYLRYSVRTQLFSRALPLAQVKSVLKKLEIIRQEPERRTKLWKNTKRFQDGLRAMNINIANPKSPITPILINGTEADGINILMELRAKGVFSYIVCYPVVPKDTCLIRMVPTANHSDEDIDQTLAAFAHIKQKFPGMIASSAILKENS